MSDKVKSSDLEELAKEQLLYPQEQLAPAKKGKQSLVIGIPKEMMTLENRVALTPDGVAVLIANGHQILIEAGAGEAADFKDKDYSEAGAQIEYDRKKIYEAAIVIKIEPPTQEELNFIKPQKTLISALPTAKLTKAYLQEVSKKRLTALAFEYLEDKSGGMPVVRAMSEICGSTVMLIAAEYLNTMNQGRGIVLGGITGVPPTKVVIIGAGTVAEYAARTAIGLGAEVKIFDNHIYKLRRVKYAIGRQVFTSTLDTVALNTALSTADVAIGAMRAEGGVSPCIVTEEMVSQMRDNSIIIDVSIDQGGCFETSEIRTHKNPAYKRHGVVHYCVPNIASRVAHTSSQVLSNIFTPLLLKMAEYGGVEKMMYADKWFTKGVYAYKSKLTNAGITRKLNLPYSDISLLLAGM